KALGDRRRVDHVHDEHGNDPPFSGGDGHAAELYADAGGHEAPDAPRAAQAWASTVNGAGGRSRPQVSLSSSGRSASRRATYAPEGPTPSRYGCHHSSKLAYSTLTARSPSSTFANPAAANSSRRWPSRAPASPDSSAASGSSWRTAVQ